MRRSEIPEPLPAVSSERRFYCQLFNITWRLFSRAETTGSILEDEEQLLQVLALNHLPPAMPQTAGYMPCYWSSELGGWCLKVWRHRIKCRLQDHLLVSRYLQNLAGDANSKINSPCFCKLKQRYLQEKNLDLYGISSLLYVQHKKLPKCFLAYGNVTDEMGVAVPSISIRVTLCNQYGTLLDLSCKQNLPVSSVHYVISWHSSLQ